MLPTSFREFCLLVARVGRTHVPVEVKYQGRVTGKDREAIYRSFGEGLVLSLRSFDLEGPVRIIRASVFLLLAESGAPA